MLNEELKGYIKLPVRKTGYGYIYDADGHMVADNHDEEAEKKLEVAAIALNAANGFDGLENPSGFQWALSKLMALPVAYYEESNAVIDAKGRSVLRVRGWGRLQKLGHERGILGQIAIGRAFADAINNLPK